MENGTPILLSSFFMLLWSRPVGPRALEDVGVKIGVVPGAKEQMYRSRFRQNAERDDGGRPAKFSLHEILAGWERA